METSIRGFQPITDCGNWLLLEFLISVVLQKLNGDICCINHYPVDNATVFSNSYPVDSTHQLLNNSRPGQWGVCEREGILVSVVLNRVAKCS